MNSGWIILDKDSGLFSRSAATRVARIFSVKKFGHIGTLDPMASGVLPVALGHATKMIPFLEDKSTEKEYLFSCVFGAETDSLDITGTEINRNDVIPTVPDIQRVISAMRGSVLQTPPAFSAVHINGRRAYEIARSGNIPDIPPRRVNIYALELLSVQDGVYNFRVVCSRGTYVRAIARDIAHACGAYATVNMIRRIKTNGFEIKNAVKLDFLENLFNNSGDFKEFLKPIDTGLGDIPVLNLADKFAVLYRHGGFINVGCDDGLRRVYVGDEFIGIGDVRNGVLQPKRTI